MNRTIEHRLKFAVGLFVITAFLLSGVISQAQTQSKAPAKNRPVVSNAAQPKTQPADLTSVVQTAAKGTKPDEKVLKAASDRDENAAQALAQNYIEEAKKKDRKSGLLEPSEINRVLVLDYNLPQYHLQLAESYLSNAENKTEDPLVTSEFGWQHLEWLRLNAPDKKLEDRLAEIRKHSPPRPSEATTGITNELLAAARKTFQAGMAFHITYPAGSPIEFEVGNAFAINMPIIRIKYIRSPEYPPHGCRVVAYMLISRDGSKPERKAIHKNYEPCIFPTGLLEASYVAMGRVQLNAETKMFVHVESSFEAKDKPGTIISNTLEIPIVAKK